MKLFETIICKLYLKTNIFKIFLQNKTLLALIFIFITNEKPIVILNNHHYWNNLKINLLRINTSVFPEAMCILCKMRSYLMKIDIIHMSFKAPIDRAAVLEPFSLKNTEGSHLNFKTCKTRQATCSCWSLAAAPRTPTHRCFLLFGKVTRSAYLLKMDLYFGVKYSHIQYLQSNSRLLKYINNIWENFNPI